MARGLMLVMSISACEAVAIALAVPAINPHLILVGLCMTRCTRAAHDSPAAC